MKKTIIVLALVFCYSAMCAQENTEQQTDVNQYGVVVKKRPVDVSEQDGFLVMKGKDAASDYKLWFDIRVQADAATFFGNNKDFDEIGDGSSIRRARFGVKSQVSKDWYGEIDMDLADGVVELKDALVRYTGLEGFEIQVGNFKENFSLQRNTTSRYLQFMERPMVTYIAPSRHLGFNIEYASDYVWASAGVFGQEVAGTEERTNVEDNNKDYGRGSGYSYTGKVVFRPLAKMDNASLHIGFAGSYRTPSAIMATNEYGGVRISSRNTTNINRKKYIDTDVITNVDYEFLYTAELAGHYEGLRFEGAYIGDNVNMLASASNTATKKFGGWYAQAGYLLFGGKQRYDAGGAKYTKVERGKDWGDVELCFRYEYIDLNSENIFGGSAEGYCAGLNFYANNNVKIVVNYQYNNNDRYANGKGKLLVGYDADGNPTKDYTKIVDANGKAGVDYHMLAVRFEIDF